MASRGGPSEPGSENFSFVPSERVAQKSRRYVRAIATIRRILEKIFRSIAGESSMPVGPNCKKGRKDHFTADMSEARIIWIHILRALQKRIQGTSENEH